MWFSGVRKALIGLAVSFAFIMSVAPATPAVLGLQARVSGPRAIDASGRGRVALTVQLLDGDLEPLPAGTAVRALIVSGDARLESGLSADLRTDERSRIVLSVFPGTRAGPLVIQLQAGDAQTNVQVALTADPSSTLVVGYATGGIGPVPAPLDVPDGAPDGANARRGAISVFGSGEVARGTRGTFAYDSSDTLDGTIAADPFLDNPNDRPFPTYGDASQRYDDALSTNHVFASIENGRSSASYGQFFAQAGSSSAVGGYDLLVNGAHLAVGGEHFDAGAFSARNDIAYGRAVIAPSGLAVASQALEPDIVVGSDVLTLVHLDRRSGAIVSQTPLVRGSDYVLDYASGLLRFLNIILPYDDTFDPQIVVAQYEYGGPGAHSTLLGGTAGAQLRPGTVADAWYLNDAIGSGNLTLLGAGISGTSPATAWSVSRERSQGFLPSAGAQYGPAGEAYSASVQAHGARWHVDAHFAAAEAAYDNPFGSYSVPGLTSLNAAADYAISRIATLKITYLSARNELPASSTSDALDNADRSAALSLHVTPSTRLSYHIGLRDDAAWANGATNPVPVAAGGALAPNVPGSFDSFLPAFVAASDSAGAGRTFGLDGGFNWRFAPRAAIGLSRLQPFGDAADPYDPPQTQAEFDLDVGARGKAFVRQLWQQSATPALAATQAGQTFASSAQSQTSIGFEEQAGPATYQTGYAVDHTAAGTDLFDAVGVRTRLVASDRLQADGFVQVGNSLYSTYGAAAASPFFTAFGTALTYSLAAFRATGQLQIRDGFDAGSTFGLGAAGPISPAVSLFGSYTGSHTENVVDEEGRGGLAYRPARNDRYVTLLSFDVYRTNLTDYDAYVTNVAQLQELYRSSTRTEWAASDAYKISGDAFFAPHTSILGLRGDQRIGPRFDVGAEAHWSDVAPLAAASATGFALEAGYRLGSTLRLAGGYTFAGFADPDTAVNPTHRGFYLTLSTYIDRILGWGKDR
jgi:hypothetical protein